MEPIKAVQTAYYGDVSFKTPPPDLESLLLKERIVYALENTSEGFHMS